MLKSLYFEDIKKKKEQKRKLISTMNNIILLTFIILFIYIGQFFYQLQNFGYFVKAVEDSTKVEFLRDDETRYSDNKSYRIVNKEFTTSMFYRTIEVEKYTLYKVTCFIKTEDVEGTNQVSGAQIVLKNTEEHSNVLKGDKDFTYVEFLFNSKNNDTVDVGFMLGGINGDAKGIAWFDDLKIEKQEYSISEEDSSTKWNMLVCVLKNIDLTNKDIPISTLEEREEGKLRKIIERFQSSINELSENKIEITYDLVEIEEPVSNISYSERNGYYFQEKDVYDVIQKYYNKQEYDHVFVCFKLDTDDMTWIGLGNMMYQGKGFSNVRYIDNQFEYSRYNTFPEEPFIHEFLHTLERNSKEYGYDIPELHDNEKYGYKNDGIEGLKKWYKDYMNKNIMKEDGTLIGLPKEIFKYKPVQNSMITNSEELGVFNDPKNIFEDIGLIVNRLTNEIKESKKQIDVEGEIK